MMKYKAPAAQNCLHKNNANVWERLSQSLDWVQTS